MSNNLVTTWLDAEREHYGMPTPADALRLMNTVLGTKYGSSMLWAWRHPEQSHRSPSTAARNYMMSRSMPWILQRCGVRTTSATAQRIAEALT